MFFTHGGWVFVSGERDLVWEGDWGYQAQGNRNQATVLEREAIPTEGCSQAMATVLEREAIPTEGCSQAMVSYVTDISYIRDLRHRRLPERRGEGDLYTALQC
ncbi:UNVERIFIED_CONTAM: hypothetical protein FKN15_075335 [Acipenser sinensis]